LSIVGCSVQLADGSHSSAIDVDTYVTQQPIIPPLKSKSIPMIVFKADRITVFVDKAHPVFKVFRIRPEQMIAAEVALYIYTQNGRLTTQQYFGQHGLSSIEWTILNNRWANELEDSAERVQADVQAFFSAMKDRLPDLLGEKAGDFFDDLDDSHKKTVVENMLAQGIDIAQLGKMKASGRYVRFLDARTIVDIFRQAPEYFFDGKFWEDTYNSIIDLPPNVIEQAQQRLRTIYLDCLEDIARFIGYNDPDLILTQRARASLGFLQQRIS
jgi:hypothetical protein